METRTCYDIFHDEENGGRFAEIYTISWPEKRVLTDVEVTGNMVDIESVRRFVERKYPNAILIHVE